MERGRGKEGNRNMNERIEKIYFEVVSILLYVVNCYSHGCTCIWTVTKSI